MKFWRLLFIGAKLTLIIFCWLTPPIMLQPLHGDSGRPVSWPGVSGLGDFGVFGDLGVFGVGVFGDLGVFGVGVFGVEVFGVLGDFGVFGDLGVLVLGVFGVFVFGDLGVLVFGDFAVLAFADFGADAVPDLTRRKSSGELARSKPSF